MKKPDTSFGRSGMNGHGVLKADSPQIQDGCFYRRGLIRKHGVFTEMSTSDHHLGVDGICGGGHGTQPNVPTDAELGFPHAIWLTYAGLCAPKNTPEVFKKAFLDASNKIHEAPELKREGTISSKIGRRA
jgi:tripartite-type tricarboxylate transporter receptor subunit TctC